MEPQKSCRTTRHKQKNKRRTSPYLAKSRRWCGGGFFGQYRQARHAIRRQGKDAQRPRYVLDGLLALVLEKIRELVPNLLARGPRDTDPAWFGQAFQPGRDVYAIGGIAP